MGQLLGTVFTKLLGSSTLCQSSAGTLRVRPQAALGAGSEVVSQSAFYPPKMACRIVQVWKGFTYQGSSRQLMADVHVLERKIQEFFPEVPSSSSVKRPAGVLEDAGDMDVSAAPAASEPTGQGEREERKEGEEVAVPQKNLRRTRVTAQTPQSRTSKQS